MSLWQALLAKLPHRHTAAEFLKFSAVGVFNTFVDFGVYVALTRLTVFWSGHLVLSAAASFTVAATSSFFLNTFWTFRCQTAGWHRRIGKFFAVATGGLALNALILFSFTRLGVYDLLAKFTATGLVLVWNFFLQKKWTFRA